MFNIAIDGPSAAGKSTIADILAEKLGYVHLDTGSMYRAVAYKSISCGVDLENEDAVVKMIDSMNLVIKTDGSVIVDDEDITGKIRTNEISMAASNVSKFKKVRAAMVKMQQDISSKGGYILDGRDIGTVVLPNAEVKFFMTASAESRADRRVKQNIEKGIEADYQMILEDIVKRDLQDSTRENSPLKQADDAVLVDSSNMGVDEVVQFCLDYIEGKKQK